MENDEESRDNDQLEKEPEKSVRMTSTTAIPASNPVTAANWTSFAASPPLTAAHITTYSSALAAAAADDATSSSRRRRREDLSSVGNVEDILGQITAKMDSLSTGTDSRQHMFDAFVSVLSVEKAYAEFFLESAAWQLEVAVSLCLENMGSVDAAADQQYGQRDMGLGVDDSAAGLDGGVDGGNLLAHDHKRRHRHSSNQQSVNATSQHPHASTDFMQLHGIQTLNISGLSFPWMARVSRSNGQVVFVNQQSGESQYQWPDWVPPFTRSVTNNDDDEGDGEDVGGTNTATTMTMGTGDATAGDGNGAGSNGDNVAADGNSSLQGFDQSGREEHSDAHMHGNGDNGGNGGIDSREVEAQMQAEEEERQDVFNRAL